MTLRNVSAFIIFMLFFIICSVSHADLKLAWDPPATGEVNGYKIYYGTSSGNYTKTTDAGKSTQYDLSALSLMDNTVYYFIVKAYNNIGESPASNEISWKSSDSTPPAPPQGLHFK